MPLYHIGDLFENSSDLLIEPYLADFIKPHHNCINKQLSFDKINMAQPRFIESVRQELRTKRYSLRTEKVYLAWIKSLILFNYKKHPNDMGNYEIERFLNHFAVNR